MGRRSNKHKFEQNIHRIQQDTIRVFRMSATPDSYEK